MRNEDSLTIEVVGAGTVGGATGRALEDWGHNVVFKDPDSDVRESLAQDGYQSTTPDEQIDSDLALIAVPTPYDEEAGRMRTHIVEDAVSTIADQDPSVVAVRSTVPPTTTKRLAENYGISHYGMVPEFVFQDSARQDLGEMDEVVIGAETRYARETLKQAFSTKVATFIEVTPTEAELVKMAGNSFAATKISFSNEIWRLANETDEKVGRVDIDGDNVLSAIRQVSPWFGPEMGMEGGWPYGGHCLPKDTRGLRAWAEQDRSVLLPQLGGTIAENEMTRSFDMQVEQSAVASEVSDD